MSGKMAAFRVSELSVETGFGDFSVVCKCGGKAEEMDFVYVNSGDIRICFTCDKCGCFSESLFNLAGS